MMQEHEPIPLDSIRAAQERIAATVLRTPLVRLAVDDTPAEIYLKLENLQPIGSFKLRGAANALAMLDDAQLAEGVWTASAGNMAQGVAWCARRLGVPCTVVAPDSAPATKREAIERLGARIVSVSFGDWLETFRTQRHPEATGTFVHAFSDPAVMAGNATIGLEVLEDVPDLDAMLVPWGGGGLCCGIASAVRALAPNCRVYACEAATAAPLAASLAAGEAVEVDYTPSFVDGIGAPVVFPEMLTLAKRLVNGSLVSSLDDIAAAVRVLVERNRVVAEGAGAAALAAALTGKAGGGKVVCVVSGGNIDTAKLVGILMGHSSTDSDRVSGVSLDATDEAPSSKSDTTPQLPTRR
jgi:threonine dehydratase